MSAFHFGPDERRLYGFYHLPESGSEGAVVLCPSWGIEYLFAHRSLRVTADRLAKSGHHVLRFDYSGTGDSWGDSHHSDLDRWEEDVGHAIDEIRDLSDERRVTLVGLRLGGWLALKVGARRTDVDRVVLWDPVLHGPTWFNELARDSGIETPPFNDPAKRPNILEVGRHRVSEGFAQQLNAIDPSQLSWSDDTAVILVDTRDGADGSDPAASLSSVGSFAVERVSSPPVWLESVSIERGQTAVGAIDRIDHLLATS